MSLIDKVFNQLRAAGHKAFMPFVTAGDPDLDFTAAVIRELVARGSSMCELGIPYSDPIADGPVIQASYTRALDKKIKLADILHTVGKITPELSAPIVTMVTIGADNSGVIFPTVCKMSANLIFLSSARVYDA